MIQVMVNQGLQLEATFFGGGIGPQTVVGGGVPGQTPLLPNVSGMSRLQPIKHVLPLTGAAAMGLGASLLAGSASSEIVNIDYIGAELLSLI
jgi:hypothetical protein